MHMDIATAELHPQNHRTLHPDKCCPHSGICTLCCFSSRTVHLHSHGPDITPWPKSTTVCLLSQPGRLPHTMLGLRETKCNLQQRRAAMLQRALERAELVEQEYHCCNLHALNPCSRRGLHCSTQTQITLGNSHSYLGQIGQTFDFRNIKPCHFFVTIRVACSEHSKSLQCPQAR